MPNLTPCVLHGYCSITKLGLILTSEGLQRKVTSVRKVPKSIDNNNWGSIFISASLLQNHFILDLMEPWNLVEMMEFNHFDNRSYGNQQEIIYRWFQGQSP